LIFLPTCFKISRDPFYKTEKIANLELKYFWILLFILNALKGFITCLELIQYYGSFTFPYSTLGLSGKGYLWNGLYIFIIYISGLKGLITCLDLI